MRTVSGAGYARKLHASRILSRWDSTTRIYSTTQDAGLLTWTRGPGSLPTSDASVGANSPTLPTPPAIHLQHHAGDEPGLVGGEVEAGVGDVTRPRQAAE